MNQTPFLDIIRDDPARRDQVGTPAGYRQTCRVRTSAAAQLLLLSGLPLIFAWTAVATDQTNLSVASVQLRSTRDLTQNVARVCGAIAHCATQGVRVVVFPECALTGYFPDVVTNLTLAQLTRAEGQVAEACRRGGIYAVVGSAYRGPGQCTRKSRHQRFSRAKQDHQPRWEYRPGGLDVW
jgi:hypothetical protein